MTVVMLRRNHFRKRMMDATADQGGSPHGATAAAALSSGGHLGMMSSATENFGQSRDKTSGPNLNIEKNLSLSLSLFLSLDRRKLQLHTVHPHSGPEPQKKDHKDQRQDPRHRDRLGQGEGRL